MVNATNCGHCSNNNTEYRKKIIIIKKKMKGFFHNKSLSNSANYPVVRLQTTACPLSFTERNTAEWGYCRWWLGWRIGMHRLRTHITVTQLFCQGKACNANSARHKTDSWTDREKQVEVFLLKTNFDLGLHHGKTLFVLSVIFYVEAFSEIFVLKSWRDTVPKRGSRLVQWRLTMKTRCWEAYAPKRDLLALLLVQS